MQVDYATKAWGGLTKTYFRPRWRLFLQRYGEAVAAGRPLNTTAFKAEVPLRFSCRAVFAAVRLR